MGHATFPAASKKVSWFPHRIYKIYVQKHIVMDAASVKETQLEHQKNGHHLISFGGVIIKL